MSGDRRISVALLLLRLSVFLVMLMWTLDKFVKPDHAAAIFKKFYLIGGLSNVPIYIIGTIQLVIILGFVAGFQKRWTYLLVLFSILFPPSRPSGNTLLPLKICCFSLPGLC